MKKVIFFIVIAITIGFSISGYYYHVLKEKLDVKTISVFQIGTYATYDEANIVCDSKNKIFYDGKLYHVYDSVVSSDKAKERLIKFYDNNNIKYNIKTRYVSRNTYNNIDNYSKLIEISDNEALKIINKQVIEKYGSDIL